MLRPRKRPDATIEWYDDGQPERVRVAPAPKPYADWPPWARGVERLRQEGEQGVGSTIERLAGTAGIGAAYKSLWRSLGTSCNCDARRDTLDAKYPYALALAGGVPG